jgi:hypothetical protein
VCLRSAEITPLAGTARSTGPAGGGDLSDRRLNIFGQPSQHLEAIGCQYKNRESAALEVLLVAQSLVGGQKQLKLRFSSAEQLPIADAGPTHLPDRLHLPLRQPLHQVLWQALIHKDPQPCAPANTDSLKC